MRVAIGSDDGGDIDMISSDFFDEIGEDGEAGDGFQFFCRGARRNGQAEKQNRN